MSIKIKSAQEISAMRESGKILGKILKDLSDYLEPGMSTLDLEKKAEELFVRYGARPSFKGYMGYPNILCTSVNDEVVHSIPNDIPMGKGDILSIDCGAEMSGMHTDSAVAVIVGGETSPLAKRLVDTCISALFAAISTVKAGTRLGDIGHAIQSIVEANGFTIIRDLTGHGIGHTVHEEPCVLNYGSAGKGEILPAGATIAIEPIISAGRGAIETLDNDWTIVTRDGSLSIQHEHTILVTEKGCEILTRRPGEEIQK
ncbi:MAG: type I methionyl aminopeptidase [Candidatus Gracilibacteria bacterium]|jgi:methionyl aminopeptidase